MDLVPFEPNWQWAGAIMCFSAGSVAKTKARILQAIDCRLLFFCQIPKTSMNFSVEFEHSKTARLTIVCLAVVAVLWGVVGQSSVSAAQATAAKRAESKHVQIQRVQDVEKNWQPNQHLFVKGDIGVSDEQLAKLERWLDENGAHWTIVLMHNARDESYTTPGGQTFARMDAVEYGLAHHLKNQTDFGDLVHEKTGESSGAIFVLFLVERKFSYYSSDVHDRRGIGQSRWIGNLDREAVRAMRSGGRIIDAVRNTVKQVEGKLARQIKQEEVDKERAKQREIHERAKLLDGVRTLIVETQTDMIPRVESSAREVRTKYPQATESELAKPPVESWKTALNGFSQEVENPLYQTVGLRKSAEFNALQTGVAQVRTEINRHLDSYAAHHAFDDMMYSVEARLDAIADHPSGLANEPSVEAYALLDQARAGHERGELGFAQNIDKAQELIKAGEHTIATEQARLKKLSDQKKAVRRAMIFVAIGLGAAFLLVLWILNVRRRPALRRAHSLFEKQSKTVDFELAGVATVLEESESVVGTLESFSDARYEGATLALGNSAHLQIAQLKHMNSEALRAMDACDSLLHPSSLLAEAANMFSSSRYEHCINNLVGKSLRGPGELDAAGVPTEPRWMNFDEFFSDVHQRKNGLVDELVVFDSCQTQIEGEVKQLQAKIDAATALENKISRAARLDRIFKLPGLFDKLIPASQSDCDFAGSLANADPVRAMNDVIPLGMRKIDDGLLLAKTIVEARENRFPRLEGFESELKQQGFDNRWISEKIDSLSDLADRLVSDAADQSVTNEATEFAGELSGLEQRAKRSVELGEVVVSQLHPRLDTIVERIATARKQIAKSLEIDETKSLREQHYDPDLEVKQAREQLNSAKAALDYGGVESAMESLEVFHLEANHADKLVETSLKCLQVFKSEFSNRSQNHASLISDLPRHDDLIGGIKSKYAATALVIRNEEFVSGAWDDLVPHDDSPNVEGVMMACRQLLGSLQTSIAQLKVDHAAGRILEASNSLHLVESDLVSVTEMLAEIDEHQGHVVRLAVDNSKNLSSCDERLKALLSHVEDRRTQRPTIQQFADLKDMLGNFRSVFSSTGTPRDPFVDAIAVGDFESRVVDLQTALQADQHVFEEASRAAGGATSELATASQLVSESHQDRIPDSRTVSACQQEISKLDADLGNVAQRLETAHDDWKQVGGEATQLHSRLGIVNGRLRQELQLAQQAVETMAEAANAVYEAANWRGSYSIVVIGRPGSDSLDEARRQLSRGSYDGSIEFSKLAKRESRDGIERAKQQVARHRRELARKAAAARRRRQASMFSSSSGSSSRSSGFGSSFGSSSRSSSISRSSSSSSRSGSSSGFSRSGW